MPNKLNVWVHVGDERYGPDDDVPQDVANQITNPDVWAEGGPGNAAEVDVRTRADSPFKFPEERTKVASDAVRPPTHGAGSGRDAWVAYAVTQDVEVSDDMTRDDIVAAVDATK